MTNSQKVYAVVSKIPLGKVLTYKLLAEISGVNNPRVVGTILHKNPDPANIPCHRVVNSQGKLADKFAFGGIHSQQKLLEKEGIIVLGDKVSLDTYLWKLQKSTGA